jgi:GT2 family glycosyltransferase
MVQIPMPPLVYLVVLNWNGYDDTHECLLSLRTLAYGNYRVLVVDNASVDDSPQHIAAEHPEAELVRIAVNHGIAAGYNRGIEAALAGGAEYVVIMNNDLVVDPLFVGHMLVVAQRTPRCGIVMPKIYYHEAPNTIWSAGAYARWMPTNIVMRGRVQPDGPAFASVVPLQFAPSCCLLLSRDLCQHVAFDEHYYFYYDDWDFCKAARDQGYSLMFAPGAHVWHKVSRTTQNSPRSLRWWKILGQSCVRYHRKHHSLAVLALYVAWVVLRETVKGNLKSLPTFLSGIRAGLRARTVDDMRPGWSS